MSNLTAEQITARINSAAELAISAEDEVRAALAKHLTDGFTVTSSNLEAFLREQAEAANWRGILRRIKRGQDAAEAVREMRDDLTDLLLTGGDSQSTSAITNDMARMERAAARQFLSATRRLV